MIMMKTNHEQAQECLRKAHEAFVDGNVDNERYWLMRAQVYATLASADH